jgi:hypothetical protein
MGVGAALHGAAASAAVPWAAATRPTPRGYFTATYVEVRLRIFARADDRGGKLLICLRAVDCLIYV